MKWKDYALTRGIILPKHSRFQCVFVESFDVSHPPLNSYAARRLEWKKAKELRTSTSLKYNTRLISYRAQICR